MSTQFLKWTDESACMDVGWADISADVTLTRGGRWRWDVRLRGKEDDTGHVEKDHDFGGWSETEADAMFQANDVAITWITVAHDAFVKRTM